MAALSIKITIKLSWDFFFFWGGVGKASKNLSTLYFSNSSKCVVLCCFLNKIQKIALQNNLYLFLLHGEVIWQASDSSLSKELHALVQCQSEVTT